VAVAGQLKEKEQRQLTAA